MKRKDLTEIKSKTIKDLKKMVYDRKFEAAKLKMNVMSGKEKDLKVYKNKRIEVAQILTVIKEKEILEKIEAAKPKVEKGVAKK